MSQSQTKTLLLCESESCSEQFVDTIDEGLTGDAASLPAALKAHKAGWQILQGKIFCPRCAPTVEQSAP